MKYCIIFDLDGTLLDTPRAIVETFNATFVSMEYQRRSKTEIRSTIGLPLEQAFSTLLGIPVDDTVIPTLIAQYQILFKSLILPKAKNLIFPGVKEGLRLLQQGGFSLAIATSKFQMSAESILVAAEIRNFFDFVVGADRVSRPKPYPESAYEIMKNCGVSPDRTLMVGDTTHDLLMANAAGIQSVGVTYGIHSARELKPAGPTWVVNSFDGVLKCIHSAYRSSTINSRLNSTRGVQHS